MIPPISTYSGSNSFYGNYGSYGSSLGSSLGNGFGSGVQMPGMSSAQNVQNPLGIEEKDARHGGKCETCEKRKYQDGSDEMVSYKSPTNISPENAASAVKAHEQEHVSNAYSKAAKNNGKVISANVSIHTAICPECGRSYVSGGTTSTQIKYYNETNPYQQSLKSADQTKYTGMFFNAGV